MQLSTIGITVFRFNSISIQLFKSARAEYTEVLLTQREALDSKIEIIETKRDQFLANVKVYQALGGGWN